jgi:hypothetical protein
MAVHAAIWRVYASASALLAATYAALPSATFAAAAC